MYFNFTERSQVKVHQVLLKSILYLTCEFSIFSHEYRLSEPVGSQIHPIHGAASRSARTGDGRRPTLHCSLPHRNTSSRYRDHPNMADGKHVELFIRDEFGRF